MTHSEWAVLRDSLFSKAPVVTPCASEEEAVAMLQLLRARERTEEDLPSNVTLGASAYGPPYLAKRDVGPWERL